MKRVNQRFINFLNTINYFDQPFNKNDRTIHYLKIVIKYPHIDELIREYIETFNINAKQYRDTFCYIEDYISNDLEITKDHFCDYFRLLVDAYSVLDFHVNGAHLAYTVNTNLYKYVSNYLYWDPRKDSIWSLSYVCQKSIVYFYWYTKRLIPKDVRFIIIKTMVNNWINIKYT